MTDLQRGEPGPTRMIGYAFDEPPWRESPWRCGVQNEVLGHTTGHGRTRLDPRR